MSEQLYLVHDRTRGYVGNSMVFWRKNHQGYTCKVTEAHQFKESELKGMAEDLVAYPFEVVAQHMEIHAVNVPGNEGIQLGKDYDSKL